MAQYKTPDIKIGPPGPNASDWVSRDESVISQSYTRAYPLVVEKGEGVYIEDVDGYLGDKVVRIGQITMYGDNYGACLQAFALQKILEKKGIEVRNET